MDYALQRVVVYRHRARLMLKRGQCRRKRTRKGSNWEFRAEGIEVEVGDYRIQLAIRSAVLRSLYVWLACLIVRVHHDDTMEQ